MNQQEQRLRELYAAMGDEELMDLAGTKGELTEVAQQAVGAEMAARGLVEPLASVTIEEAMPELPEAEDDATVVELMTFEIASEAAIALKALDDSGIPVRMEPAMRRLVEGGPKVKTNWLTIYVERSRQEDGVRVLRQRMGLFPVLAADEMEKHEDTDEDSLAIVGDFEVEADAMIAQKALTDAGIWFKVEAEAGKWAGATVLVRAEDLERALDAVEAAFSEG